MYGGEDKAHLVALVVLTSKGQNGLEAGSDELTLEGQQVNPVDDVLLVSEALNDSKFQDIVRDAIEACNSFEEICRRGGQRIERFKILPRDFCIENGEISHTGKYRRDIIYRKWQQDIESMYTDDASGAGSSEKKAVMSKNQAQAWRNSLIVTYSSSSPTLSVKKLGGTVE